MQTCQRMGHWWNPAGREFCKMKHPCLQIIRQTRVLRKRILGCKTFVAAPVRTTLLQRIRWSLESLLPSLRQSPRQRQSSDRDRNLQCLSVRAQRQSLQEVVPHHPHLAEGAQAQRLAPEAVLSPQANPGASHCSRGLCPVARHVLTATLMAVLQAVEAATVPAAVRALALAAVEEPAAVEGRVP